MTIEEMVKNLIERQTNLNDLTYPGWREKLYIDDWQCAIIAETGEALDSFGYKWWKKQETDEENLKMELVDILHFLISKAMYYDAGELSLVRNIKDALEHNYNMPMKKCLAKLGSGYLAEQIFYWTLAAKQLGKFEDFYRLYFIKNVLNEFRQKHGYKDGTYVKIIDGREDNYWITQIAQNLPLEKIATVLYKVYEKFYKKHAQWKETKWK